MKLFNLFKNKPILITPETDIKGDGRQNKEPRCNFCDPVYTAGRSGEKELRYDDGSIATIEIINEKGVNGRGRYTMNILNDLEVGWADAPIKYCPYCGKRLGRKK